MAVIAGWKARLYLGNADAIAAGATVPMTLISAKRYRCTSAAQDAWDPAGGIVVEDDGSPVDAANYTVNWLLGQITFASSYTVAGDVVATVNTFPKLQWVGVRRVEISAEAEVLDASQLGDGFMRRILGRKGASGTFEGFSVDDAGGYTLDDTFTADGYTFLEVRSDGNSPLCHRAYARFIDFDPQSPLDDVSHTIVSWVSTGFNNRIDGYAYGDPTT